MIGVPKLIKLTAFKWNEYQSVSQIREATRGDPRDVLHFSWLASGKFQLKIYYSEQDNFNVEDGCILRGTRVVISNK